MSAVIKRTIVYNPLWEIYEKYMFRVHDWEIKKSVCVIEGLASCGKTTYVLEYLKNKQYFYFSFAGYGEALAETLFTEYVTEMTDTAVHGWEDAFKAVAAKYKYIVFDDLGAITSCKRFKQAFYGRMITNILTRPFIILIAQPDDNVSGMADNYDYLDMGYFGIPEAMKLYPSVSKYDILGMCAVTGGIPKILAEYDPEKPFIDNLRNMLRPASAFCNLMPELLSHYLRKPEIYHQVMHAIANGNHSISGIGKYTGFAYNKCDNYLSRLIKCGFVEVEKVLSDRGAEKTAYVLTNNYFKLWYLYIFRNRTQIRLCNQDLIDSITKSIIETEIHAYHQQKAFALVNMRVHNQLWASFGIGEQIMHKPQIVHDVTNPTAGKFSYTFDAIFRKGKKAVFIKVFEDPQENCKKDELERIRDAVSLVNKYYDSQVFIFTKRRFSDHAVKESGMDDNLSLVEVDRLKW